MLAEFEYFKRMGMIARWRPVHRGHAIVLRALCERADQVLIGIGSSNRYNVRNPFALAEATDMLRLVLADRKNYSIIPVPDLDDGPRWRGMVVEMFGSLDLFVTGNPYVASLLENDYRIVHPIELIRENERVAIDGTMVRRAMAQGNAWREFVPESIADYIVTRKLDERFRREFGLETLAMQTIMEE